MLKTPVCSACWGPLRRWCRAQLWLATADADPDRVAEVFLRAVAGDSTWKGFPPQLQAMFAANGPAIVAEFRGGFLDVTAEQLGTIQVPTLLVYGEASPLPFRRATEVMAAAIPGARVAAVGGGHLIHPGSPEEVSFVAGMLDVTHRRVHREPGTAIC